MLYELNKHLILFTLIVITLASNCQALARNDRLISDSGIIYHFDTASLKLEASVDGKNFYQIIAATSELAPSTTATTNLTGDDLTITVQIPANSTIKWPVINTAGAKNLAIPIGEGIYIPTGDPGWQRWLINTSGKLTEQLSMYFLTIFYDDLLVNIIIDNPLASDINFFTNNKPTIALKHNSRTQEQYRIQVTIAKSADIVFGAKKYRSWLKNNGLLTSLHAKAKTNRNINKLAGAPFIYLWGSGLLKYQDIINWPKFVTRLCASENNFIASIKDFIARSSDSEILRQKCSDKANNKFVTVYDKKALTRLINKAVTTVVKKPEIAVLPGGHDPKADIIWAGKAASNLRRYFPGLLAPVDSWGGGMSGSVINGLQASGIDRAWLGVENWQDALWHPQAVIMAKKSGYLVAAYDSYNTAISPNKNADWLSAHMGREIADTGGYRNADGKLIVGFGGNGVYTNPVVIADYAQTRMTAISKTAGLNSLFLDADATGMLYADHTPGRQTSEADDLAGRRKRLEFAANKLGLVVGSEGISALFASVSAFGHGTLTPYFAWRDHDMRRNKQSKYNFGKYWPPEMPSFFFKQVPLKPTIARYTLDPGFKVPLFEIALHDSVVSSHHWINSSLKFKGWVAKTALSQLLYMVPPIYHVNYDTLASQLPIMARFYKLASPLRRQLFSQTMTDFNYLSRDRMVQQTTFSDNTRVIVNFAADERHLPPGKHNQMPDTIKPLSAIIINKSQKPLIIDIMKLLK